DLPGGSAGDERDPHPGRSAPGRDGRSRARAPGAGAGGGRGRTGRPGDVREGGLADPGPVGRVAGPVSLQFQHDDSGEDFFALTTYRQNGAGVTTPVWMAPAGGHWYVYTAGRSGKVRRIRREERAQLAPADVHGEPTGAAGQARARITPESHGATA